jgi:hypothetical protein
MAISNYGTITLKDGQKINFNATDNSFAVSLHAPGTLAAAVALTLPASDTTSGIISSNGAGVLSIAQLVNANVSAAAAIALTKLAATTASRALVSDGSGVISASTVTATELGYVSGVTSAIQTQFAGTIPLSQKGAASGIASLDAGGRLPVSQLPTGSTDYLGTWNASTNTPTLADGTGRSGDFYIVSVAGSQNLGSGILIYAIGDWVLYNGTIWQKVVNSNAVTSVNGAAGAVIVNAISQLTGDVTAGPASGSASATATISAGAVDNSKISAGAAIARSKLAALTANRAMVTDASGFDTVSATTDTEISYVSGVTSAVQTQLNSKASTALSNLTVAGLTTADILYASSSSAVTRLGIGTAGQVLTVAGGVPSWAAPGSSSFKANWITADGTTKTITHNLGSLDVIVQLYDKTDGSTIGIDSEVRTNANTLTVTASSAPGAAGWRVLILAV